jgi:tRNA 2-(methylsulfanyl)-N6-isopentenyladenosine37 hydroxylase
LKKRGIPLAPLNAPPYFTQLKSQIRHQEPERLIDSLLISAIIEARSHERLGLIGEYCPEPETLIKNFLKAVIFAESIFLELDPIHQGSTVVRN